MARGPTTRPVTPRLLVAELAERVFATAPAGWARVAVDGAPAARPGALADEITDALRERGRAVLRVSAIDFLRPASVRLERGRHDPDAYYEGWLDEQALRREVLRPLDREGNGMVLPRLWNAITDRSYRAERVTLPVPGVLLLDGVLLLGRGLPLELTAHLALSDDALFRRTPPEQRWTLPAYDRYRREVDPERVADVVVRWDHPSHPAVRTAAAG
jgi:hypothetical protein